MAFVPVLVPFTTNGQGASYGFEYLNTGANAIHMISNTVGNASAAGWRICRCHLCATIHQYRDCGRLVLPVW